MPINNSTTSYITFSSSANVMNNTYFTNTYSTLAKAVAKEAPAPAPKEVILPITRLERLTELGYRWKERSGYDGTIWDILDRGGNYHFTVSAKRTDNGYDRSEWLLSAHYAGNSTNNGISILAAQTKCDTLDNAKKNATAMFLATKDLLP